MLPINPKIASLYLQGRSLMAGFHLGIEILSMIPVEFAEERELWEKPTAGRRHSLPGL
jgi:hypothetical protein